MSFVLIANFFLFFVFYFLFDFSKYFAIIIILSSASNTCSQFSTLHSNGGISHWFVDFLSIRKKLAARSSEGEKGRATAACSNDLAAQRLDIVIVD